MDWKGVLGLALVFSLIAPALAAALATPQAAVNFLVTPGSDNVFYIIIQNTDGSIRNGVFTADSSWITFGDEGLKEYRISLPPFSSTYIPAKITVPTNAALGIYEMHINLDGSSNIFMGVGVEVTLNSADVKTLQNMSNVNVELRALQNRVDDVNQNLMDTRLNMNTSLGNLSENINDVNSQLTSTSSQVGDRIESKLEEVFAYNKQVAENLQQENKALSERTTTLESSKDSLTQMTGNIVASQTITFFVGFAVAIMAFYLFMRKPGYHPKV